jgi:hypothetical protein
MTQFLRNLVAGGYRPLERVRRVAANLRHRSWGGPVVCCGNYGDPGC